MQDPGAHPSRTSLPRMLGRYALYEKIASGGMASVHLGRLLGPVGFARTVAIKRMHAQFAEDPAFVSMFLDEARLAARIRHPNVVPTLDVVATEGELFLVMDFVQGESLARLLRSSLAVAHRIPPEMVASLVVGVLHGLHAAHDAKSDRGEPLGIVHRDVSPHNVLVGVDGVARVIDFGVAKAVGRVQTTREGQLKGKLAYMAPEQIRGKVSRTTDVYAASIVLWEALTGERLFSAENEGALLDRVMRGCDVPPSNYVAGLPRTLDEVTMRGLSIDPAKRFPSAREMARALEDAVRLAPASRIGDWVEAAAKETLDARSRRIAAIEGDTSMSAGPPSSAASLISTDGDSSPSGGAHDRGAWGPPISIHPPGSVAPPPTGVGPPTELRIPTHPPFVPKADKSVSSVAITDEMLLTSGSASSPNRTVPPPRPRSIGLIAASAVVGMVLAAVLLAVAVSRTGEPATPDTAAAAMSPPATSLPARPDPSPSPPSPATAASVVAQPAPAVTAELPATTVGASPVPSAAAAPPVPVATTPEIATPPRPPPVASAPASRPTSRCNPPWTKDARGVQVFKKECL